MGLIIPEDFPLAQLRNDAERRVVEAFRDQLNDGWLIIPSLSLWAKDRGDHELDIVLIHHGFGVANIEVKGHRVEIRDGLWCSGGKPLDPQPLKQASANAYALRDRLRQESDAFRHQYVEFGVALPNTDTVTGALPPGMHRAQVITARDLEDAAGAIDRLMSSRWGNQALSDEVVRDTVRVLCPSVQFSWNPAARASCRPQSARRSMRRSDQSS